MLQKLINTILYIWQLPQNVVALFLLLYLKIFKALKKSAYTHNYKNVILYRTKKFGGGISLGNYVIISYPRYDLYNVLKHEVGHCKQSIILGPLYLFIIGIPSLIHAITFTSGNYYNFYTEKWADKLSNNE